MASATGQYQLFGVARNNLKQDVLAALIVCSLVVLLILVFLVDFNLPWAKELVEENEEAGPILP